MYPPHQPFSYITTLLAWRPHGTGVNITLNFVMSAHAAATVSDNKGFACAALSCELGPAEHDGNCPCPNLESNHQTPLSHCIALPLESDAPRESKLGESEQTPEQ